jgi:glycine cleavage system H protein
MNDIDTLEMPDDRLYTLSHEWAKKEDEIIVIGISDYAQNQLGDIVYVELPSPGDHFAKGDEFGTVESVKAVSEVYMPVGGTILAVNESLSNNPAFVNVSPYNEGWMLKVQPDNTDELNTLLEKDTYLSILKGE